jgi:hypothetical protein
LVSSFVVPTQQAKRRDSRRNSADMPPINCAGFPCEVLARPLDLQKSLGCLPNCSSLFCVRCASQYTTCAICLNDKRLRQKQRQGKSRAVASMSVGASDSPVLIGRIAAASEASVRDGASDSPVIVGRIAAASDASVRVGASDSPVIIGTTRTRRSIKTAMPELCGCGCGILDSDVALCGVLNSLCSRNSCAEKIRVECGKCYRTCLKYKKEPKGEDPVFRIPGKPTILK